MKIQLKNTKTRSMPSTPRKAQELKKSLPMIKTPKSQPLKLRKVQPRTPSWGNKGYKPGSIKRGYTKYA